MRNVRSTERPIFFLNETWTDVKMTKDKLWTISGDNPVSRAPIGKGSRIIVLNAGSKKEFVKNGLLVSKSCPTKDYHEEMDSNNFKKWFQGQLLPNIPPNLTTRESADIKH
ncbi:hypothetical protein ANN_13713 [Periplaneta americana]|uniref:Uncharacterized protein n=1 Tax=Periplaneta americana TaxID=6978 RepID=A0ABQ8SWF4_PERAM|nr:hypothetical protein ANN_13713 [Periplaneta americana]